MSKFDTYYYLGKVIKPHGYQGRVSVMLDTDDPDSYIDLKVIFIDIHGAPVPYFIEEIVPNNNRWILALQNVKTEEDAARLSQCDIYLPLDQLPKLRDDQFYYHELPGVLVVDNSFGQVGNIEDVLELGGQMLIQVYHDNKEVLIPISDEIIGTFDRSKNTLNVALPDGLLDLYLQQ